MPPDRWRQIEEIYHAALDRDPDARAGFLDEACRADPELRQEVDSLLQGERQAGSFLETRPLRTAQPSMVDRQVGPYRIVSPLGAGGMGEVYRAHDSKLGRDVALKTLPAAFAEHPEWLARFRREARTLASLNHPNIAAIYGIEESEGATCLVLELVEGGALRGPQPVAKAIDYARQVAEALEAAHAKGIVHRDLKPANVKVTPQGRVKVLDFGLAKAVSTASEDQELSQQTTLTALQTAPGQIAGTPPYMSPEQARGLEVDKRTDIWAFGCLLYELLAGKRAFRGETIADTVSAVLQREPDWSALPAKTPAKVRALLSRCLEKDIRRRVQDIRDVHAVLEQAQRKTNYLTYAVAAAALVILAILLVVVLRGPTPPAGRDQWVQLTRFPDSASQPALSPDGRMLTFIRGPLTFATSGEIYLKMLPDSEAVQLTHDNHEKMSPVFSPDGSQIAYTVSDLGNWDTWTVPVFNGQARLWLRNASGLTWFGKNQILFSEIVNNDIQMAVVAAQVSRAAARKIYVPANARSMVHRSYVSPDGKWALGVQMDRGVWVPCRLISLGGASEARSVGPPGAACTAAAWSRDGKWMYLSSSAGGNFHTWRQRFPDGSPEQITSGPTEEEGIAMAPDGRSFVTAVALRQSAVWIHSPAGERQISAEGYAYDAKFTPDGKKLLYRILKGALPSDPSELWMADLDSGQSQPLLPGIEIIGLRNMAYDISADGRQVIAAAVDKKGGRRLWLVPLDRSAAPAPVPQIEGDDPWFGQTGELFFRGYDGDMAFPYRARTDGTGIQKVAKTPMAGIVGISRDRRWLIIRAPDERSPSAVFAFSADGESRIRITAPHAANRLDDAHVKWSLDGTQMFILNPNSPGGLAGEGRAFALRVPAGKVFPALPVEGYSSTADIVKTPGAREIDGFDVAPGPMPDVYAVARETTQRNLYRIPIP